MEKVKIELDNQCRGITDEGGNHYAADKHGETTIPNSTARRLRDSGVVKPAGRLYGGFSLPKAGQEQH